MTNLSRRNFLVFSATAGLAVFSEVLRPANVARLRTGIAGGFEGSLSTFKTLSSLPELKVAALSGGHHTSLSMAAELVRAETGHAPALYPASATMMREQSLDFVVAFGEIEPLLNSRLHLLLDHSADPLACVSHLHAGRCVQILPRNEFLGAGRATSAELGRHDWTKAEIRHRTSLPSPKVASAEELHRWMWFEIGEALDFATEVIGPCALEVVQSAAAQGSPHGTLVFAFRLRSSEDHERSIEIAIHARPDDPPVSPKTEIALSHTSGSFLFRAANRSERFTRLIIRNTLEALSFRDPSRLLYSPESLLPSRNLLVSVVEHMRNRHTLT